MTAFYDGLADILEVPSATIASNLSLTDHNWDSLAIISCIALMDECFGILVSGSDLAKCTVVADLEALAPQTVSA